MSALTEEISVTTPDANAAYEQTAAQTQEAVNKAFADLPGDDRYTATARWLLINGALDAVDARLKPLVPLIEADHDAMTDAAERASDANYDGDKAATARCVGAYLYVYRAALDRR
ncbi:MAG: hypothetical protein U0835_00335 [Isosphaeraceae bacterium]